MKNLLFIVILVLGLAGQAQEGKGQQATRDFTPEQMAVIKTKKMALHLDLSQDQQDRLLKVNQSWAEKRAQQREKFKAQQGQEKPDADTRYAMQVQMLDNQMAYQNELKKILNKEQFELWREHRAKKGEHREQGHWKGQKEGPHGNRHRKGNQ